MSRARVPVPQRIRIYFGCEGQSEQSYGKRLNEIVVAVGLHLHLDNDVLQPGGGDPLALVELAIRRIEQKKKLRGGFAHCAILLDRDKLGQSPSRDEQILALARHNRLHLIWQTPCHEAFLLRHIEGQSMMRPLTTILSQHSLKSVWPEYYKGMPAAQLEARIDLQAIHRASRVEPDLTGFLGRIGFPQT